MAPLHQPVALTAQQVADLRGKISDLRHDVNNYLSLIQGAVELIRLKPDLRDRMIATISEQPPKITDAVGKFSEDLEKLLGPAETT